MKNVYSVVCTALLVLTTFSTTVAKQGTISTTKTGIISTTRTGTISTTAVGSISTSRAGTISTTRTASNNLDQAWFIELLMTIYPFWL